MMDKLGTISIAISHGMQPVFRIPASGSEVFTGRVSRGKTYLHHGVNVKPNYWPEE